MPRPPATPKTALGAAVLAARAGLSQREAAKVSGVPGTTLSEVERGARTPSLATARALSTWLGWTLDEVFQAAERPADPDDAGTAGG